MMMMTMAMAMVALSQITILMASSFPRACIGCGVSLVSKVGSMLIRGI